MLYNSEILLQQEKNGQKNGNFLGKTDKYWTNENVIELMTTNKLFKVLYKVL